MIKLVNTGLAALIAATSIAAAATPAAAQSWGYGGGYGGGYAGYGGNSGYDGYNGHDGYDRERWEHRDHDNAAPLIAAGLVGLVLVAALASSHNHAQTHNAYADGNAQPYDDHPDVCTTQRQVWDAYAGRYTTRSYRVAC